jgi:hypothetical protein
MQHAHLRLEQPVSAPQAHLQRLEQLRGEREEGLAVKADEVGRVGPLVEKGVG